MWNPLGDVKDAKANVLASGLIVAGWGYFLIKGVRDPLGAINSLWPLFGIANQLLASIALCLATTVILKMHLGDRPRPAFALVTLIPLVWLLSVTRTAGVKKFFHSDPRIGFLAQAEVLNEKLPALEAAAKSTNTDEARKAVRTNRTLQFNNYLDALVAGTFLVLVVMIVFLSTREW